MSKATVKPGQTLPDIAIEHCGGLAAWSGLASINKMAMTATLIPGQVLVLPSPTDKRTVAFFKNGRYSPAAGQVVPYGDGIGWWFIEQDFIVQ